MTCSIIQIYGVDAQVWEVPDKKMAALIVTLNAIGCPIRLHKTDNEIDESWEVD